jgi:hypothetical protein
MEKSIKETLSATWLCRNIFFDICQVSDFNYIINQRNKKTGFQNDFFIKSTIAAQLVANK